MIGTNLSTPLEEGLVEHKKPYQTANVRGRLAEFLAFNYIHLIKKKLAVASAVHCQYRSDIDKQS